jgi:histidinol-phosphatase (PHP family)
LPSDYHIHIENGSLDLSYINSYKVAASLASLSDFGISEHLTNLKEGPRLLGRVMPKGLSALGWDTEAYINTVKSFGIKAGLEADYIPETEDALRTFLAGHNFDYVIGSVHWIGDWFFDWHPSMWNGRDVTDAWRRYFETAEKAILSNMFDIFGHPDIIKIFCNKPGDGFKGELISYYRRIAEAAAHTGTCLEVSSAGLRKPCREIYPDLLFLKEAKLAGASISLGSDAHFPEHVGSEFEKIIQHARLAGYNEAATFNDGELKLKGF